MAAIGQKQTFTLELRDITLPSELTPGWRPVHVGLEGDAVSVNGVALWRHNWRQLSEDAVVVPHPSYPSERHKAWVYEVDANGETARFAAGELSNGVWGFYVLS